MEDGDNDNDKRLMKREIDTPMLLLSRSGLDGGDSVVVDVDENKDEESKNVDETDADEEDDELSEQRSNKPMAMVAIE